MTQYRHGDLLIEQVESIPAGATRADHNILAHGEATSHAHRLVGGLLYEHDGALYFDAPSTTSDPVHVLHEEHARIDFAPGSYRVIRQREYAPGELPRQVLD